MTVITTLVTARKRSLRRLCFYTCLSVILFTAGESTWAGKHPLGRYTPRAGTPGQVPPGQVHPLGRYTPLGQVHPGRYTPMVNERAVHILLECILIYHKIEPVIEIFSTEYFHDEILSSIERWRGFRYKQNPLFGKTYKYHLNST